MKKQARWLNVILSHIDTYLTEPLDPQKLADLVNISVSHLHRTFITQLGEPPVGYIRRLRLERAGHKLRMGAVDIGAVALAAGYGNHNAFSKAFKQQFGMLPSAFRALSCQAAAQVLVRRKND